MGEYKRIDHSLSVAVVLSDSRSTVEVLRGSRVSLCSNQGVALKGFPLAPDARLSCFSKSSS
jgi:hypothetical protein